MASEQDEVASLDRVLTRLALTEDDKLEKVSNHVQQTQRTCFTSEHLMHLHVPHVKAGDELEQHA